MKKPNVCCSVLGASEERQKAICLCLATNCRSLDPTKLQCSPLTKLTLSFIEVIQLHSQA